MTSQHKKHTLVDVKVSNVTPIFLLAAPKSGSTLLQRLLAAHSLISSADEPWLLLPLVYATRSEGIFAEYGARSCRISIETLSNALPGKREDYWHACGLMARDIYQKLSALGTVYFLDKTPRYHLIADELPKIFPDAKFVFLRRSPLSIMASMIEHNGGKICGLRLGQIDILDGFPNLAGAAERMAKDACLVQYENLVRDPAGELNRIMAFLDLSVEESQTVNFRNVGFDRGDRTGRSYSKVEQDSLEKWRKTLATPSRKRLAARLLGRIDREVLENHGYNKHELQQELQSLQVSWTLKNVLEFGELAASNIYAAFQGYVLRKAWRANFHY